MTRCPDAPGRNGRREFVARAAALAATGLSATGLRAELRRPVRFIVPYGPGTGADTAMRIVADTASRLWGRAAIVDNRPGASGILAMQELKKAPADGHHYVLGDVGSLAINAHLFRKLPYDPERDLSVVTDLISTPWSLFVPRSGSIASMQQLLSEARANPGRLTCGTSGRGSANSMVMGLVQLKTGIELLEVPHGAGASIATSVASGRVDVMAIPPASVENYRERLRAIAISTRERDPAWPDVPTLAETTGIADLTVLAWSMVMARSDAPASLVEKVRQDLCTVLGLQTVRSAIEKLGMRPGGSLDVSALRQGMARDARQFAAVVAAQGLTKS